MPTAISSPEAQDHRAAGRSRSASRSPASRISAIASAKTEKVAAVTNGLAPLPLAQQQRRPFHHRALDRAARRSARGRAAPAPAAAARSRLARLLGLRRRVVGDQQPGEPKIVAAAKTGCEDASAGSGRSRRAARRRRRSARRATVPKLQKAWQRVMIRRPSTRSVWLALAFIATSIVAMRQPAEEQRERRAPARSGASAGPMKLRRKIDAAPAAGRARARSRRMIRGRRSESRASCPTGMPKRQKASVSTSRPSASFTSGMRGNHDRQAERVEREDHCRAKRR